MRQNEVSNNDRLDRHSTGEKGRKYQIIAIIVAVAMIAALTCGVLIAINLIKNNGENAEDAAATKAEETKRYMDTAFNGGSKINYLRYTRLLYGALSEGTDGEFYQEEFVVDINGTDDVERISGREITGVGDEPVIKQVLKIGKCSSLKRYKFDYDSLNWSEEVEVTPDFLLLERMRVQEQPDTVRSSMGKTYINAIITEATENYDEFNVDTTDKAGVEHEVVLVFDETTGNLLKIVEKNTDTIRKEIASKTGRSMEQLSNLKCYSIYDIQQGDEPTITADTYNEVEAAMQWVGNDENIVVREGDLQKVMEEASMNVIASENDNFGAPSGKDFNAEYLAGLLGLSYETNKEDMDELYRYVTHASEFNLMQSVTNWMSTSEADKQSICYVSMLGDKNVGGGKLIAYIIASGVDKDTAIEDVYGRMMTADMSVAPASEEDIDAGEGQENVEEHTDEQNE